MDASKSQNFFPFASLAGSFRSADCLNLQIWWAGELSADVSCWRKRVLLVLICCAGEFCTVICGWHQKCWCVVGRYWEVFTSCGSSVVLWETNCAKWNSKHGNFSRVKKVRPLQRGENFDTKVSIGRSFRRVFGWLWLSPSQSGKVSGEEGSGWGGGRSCDENSFFILSSSPTPKKELCSKNLFRRVSLPRVL
jgi:hypothetical protein